MKWFASHEIVFIEHLDGVQDEFEVMENVILIGAESDADAWRQAEAHGREDYPEGDGNGLMDGEKPARLVFAGIRRLMEVTEGKFRRHGPFESGMEITFSVFTVSCREDIHRLVDNESVAVIYRPSFLWDE